MAALGAILSTTDVTSGNLQSYKTADQAVTSTTLTTATNGCSVTLAAAKYWFRFCLFLVNGGAAEGIKLAIADTSAIFTDLKAQISIWDDTLNSLVVFGRVTTFNSGLGGGASSGDNHAIIEGVCDVSTGGTLAVSFAQNATGASAGVTLQKSSSLVVVKLG